jgi:hypothetical protein
MSDLTFKGNDEQRTLAEQIYQLMISQGTLFAVDSPIRQTLSNLADFFAAQRKLDRDQASRSIDAALRENQHYFQREEHDGEVIYTTSRQGSYQPRTDRNTHMFSRRLYEPENPLPIDDISVVVTTTRPALTTVEPVFISEYWQRQAGLTPIVPTLSAPSAAEELAAPEAPEDEEAVAAAVAAPAAEEAEATPAAEEPEPEPLPAGLPGTILALPNGVQIDLRRPTADLMAQYGPTLVAQLRSALENDPLRRIVSFGNDVFPEAQIATFGKNDMRRIREYILERGEPLLDTQIIQDVFYHNQRQNDYESFRFALNYRLSREKDFEFVGVEGARLWSTKGLPSLGSKRVKASEMGQIAGYLEEGFDDSLKDQSADAIRKSGSISHVLSFFEWEYGILPFTRALATLVPSSLLHDQRTAVLRFDSPQHYVSMLIELRYPTGNRGGWLSGFEEFFHQHLIHGAMVTISRTDDPSVFTLTYEEQPETSDRLLVLDEKKNKLAFTTVAYYCTVDSDMLVNQQQQGRLRNLKLLAMNERRKGELVLEQVFQTIGDLVGTRAQPRQYATEDDLFIGMNVLRPSSHSYLQHLLRDGEYFEPDASTPGAWFYNPPPKPANSEDDEDEDDYDDDE